MVKNQTWLLGTLTLLLASLMLLMSACGGGQEEEITSPDTAETISADTETVTLVEALTDNEDMVIQTQATTETTPPEETTLPEEETKVEIDIFGNGYNPYMVVGFDEQGRTVEAVSSRRENKDVGIFYFLWLGQHGATTIYDVSHIIEEHGLDVMFHQDVPGVSPANQFHWWEEPLFGYYNSADEWVIRKHMEMLTTAGIDFLVFDTTNANTYLSVAEKIMKVVCELRAEGWDAPQVCFYTHSYAIRTMTSLYNDIYKANKYPESWYCVDGKPMIIGYMDPALDKAEAVSRGDTSYNPEAPSQEIQDFFYFREARWPYEYEVKENSFPYTDWVYPQPMNGNMMSVSVATHPALPFSTSLTHEDRVNWGRGYDVRRKKNISENAMKGTFFDAQWKTVYNQDPDMVFITGWNEWVAIKSWYDGEYTLCDNANLEYSRDIEPMVGGYEDAYYIQMIKNIRKYKYESIDGYIAATTKKTIDINGSADQWSDVNAVYRRIGTDNGKRFSVGGASDVKFKTEAVRNNILEIRVTVDADNIYFLIVAEGDITTPTATDTTWMNLFVGLDKPEMKGWESYEFVIGRSREGNTLAIETLSADYSGTQIGTATYAVQGHVMQVCVPRATLGLDNGGDFYFKVADGITDPAEIMNYYGTGRSLPLGRLSYLYQIGD